MAAQVAADGPAGLGTDGQTADRLYTVREAADEAGVAVVTIRRAIAVGELPAHRAGGHNRDRHAWLIREADLVEWA